jgi:hypothetical protein
MGQIGRRNPRYNPRSTIRCVGSAVEVGGLLLGYHDPDGKLQYAGNVGR